MIVNMKILSMSASSTTMSTLRPCEGEMRIIFTPLNWSGLCLCACYALQNLPRHGMAQWFPMATWLNGLFPKDVASKPGNHCLWKGSAREGNAALRLSLNKTTRCTLAVGHARHCPRAAARKPRAKFHASDTPSFALHIDAVRQAGLAGQSRPQSRCKAHFYQHCNIFVGCGIVTQAAALGLGLSVFT